MLTDTQRKALEFLKSNPEGMKAGDFAWLMWPDSNMHSKTSNQGNGACRGKAAWLCGGSYLGKLAKRGLVYWSSSRVASGAYYLTPEGRKAIEQPSIKLS